MKTKFTTGKKQEKKQGESTNIYAMNNNYLVSDGPLYKNELSDTARRNQFQFYKSEVK